MEGPPDRKARAIGSFSWEACNASPDSPGGMARGRGGQSRGQGHPSSTVTPELTSSHVTWKGRAHGSADLSTKTRKMISWTDTFKSSDPHVGRFVHVEFQTNAERGSQLKKSQGVAPQLSFPTVL